MTVIYALKDPCTGKPRYVGMTSKPNSRLDSHITMAKGSSGGENLFNVYRRRGPKRKDVILWASADQALVDRVDAWAASQPVPAKRSPAIVALVRWALNEMDRRKVQTVGG